MNFSDCSFVLRLLQEMVITSPKQLNKDLTLKSVSKRLGTTEGKTTLQQDMQQLGLTMEQIQRLRAMNTQFLSALN